MQTANWKNWNHTCQTLGRAHYAGGFVNRNQPQFRGLFPTTSPLGLGGSQANWHCADSPRHLLRSSQGKKWATWPVTTSCDVYTDRLCPNCTTTPTHQLLGGKKWVPMRYVGVCVAPLSDLLDVAPVCPEIFGTPDHQSV